MALVAKTDCEPYGSIGWLRQRHEKIYILLISLIFCISYSHADQCTTGIFIEGVPAGDICGTNGKNGTQAFLGIPYGESVAGELRWTDPVMKAPGYIDATQYRAYCPQAPFPSKSPTISYNLPQSEDCLNLNIATKINKTT